VNRIKKPHIGKPKFLKCSTIRTSSGLRKFIRPKLVNYVSLWTMQMVEIWLREYKHKQRRMKEDQRLKKSTSTKTRSGHGSLRFAWL
jgi:hypothetical protein